MASEWLQLFCGCGVERIASSEWRIVLTLMVLDSAEELNRKKKKN